MAERQRQSDELVHRGRAAYRSGDPVEARVTHTQQAEYLDVCQIRGEWNPSDFAHHLTRRPRGLPFWFGLVTYGTDAIAVGDLVAIHR